MDHRPELQQRDAQPYVAIHRNVTGGVAAAVDDAFPDLFAWLRAHDIPPTGPPFIRILTLDEGDEPIELEVAAPVATEVPGEGEVTGGLLPAGRYITYLHVGPCLTTGEPDVAGARAMVMEWGGRCGLRAAGGDGRSRLGCYVEHYRLGPVEAADFSLWETELACLLDGG